MLYELTEKASIQHLFTIIFWNIMKPNYILQDRALVIKSLLPKLAEKPGLKHNKVMLGVRWWKIKVLYVLFYCRANPPIRFSTVNS